MSSNLLTIKAFLDKIKSLSFFARLFQWGSVKKDLVDAATGLASMQNELALVQQNFSNAQLQLSVSQEAKRNLEAQVQVVSSELSIYKERLQNCQRDLQSVREENIQLKKEDEF